MIKDNKTLDFHELLEEHNKRHPVVEAQADTKDKVNSVYELREKWQEFIPFFAENWIKNYYDFYYLTMWWFRELLTINDELKDFFFDLYKIKSPKKITLEIIRDFAEKIWYTKLSEQYLEKEVIDFLAKAWITHKNSSFSTSMLKVKIVKNNKIKYYFLEKLNKTQVNNISYEDFVNIFENLLKTYSDEELISHIRELLLSKKIKFQEEFFDFWCNNFIFDILSDELAYLYFKNKWISNRKNLREQDFISIANELWLPKMENPEQEAKSYLISKWIHSLEELREGLSVNEVRKFLWENTACCLSLKNLWLELSKDFTLEFVKRLFKKIWLHVNESVVFNLDLSKAKQSIKSFLKQKQIEDYDTLINTPSTTFIEYFKRKDVGDEMRETINFYCRELVWKIIYDISFEDFIIIASSLDLQKLTEEEHKTRFLNLLESLDIDLSKINCQRFRQKKWFWSNMSTKFILSKAWANAYLNDFRLEDFEKLKKYLWY